MGSKIPNLNPDENLLVVPGVVNTEHMLTDKYRSMVYHTTLNTSAPVYHSHPPQPYFLSKRQQFKIKIGQDVTFPCHVNNKGKCNNLNYVSKS